MMGCFILDISFNYKTTELNLIKIINRKWSRETLDDEEFDEQQSGRGLIGS
jgi:hypothetical protein